MQYSNFASLSITTEFALEHELDPTVQPADVPEAQYDKYRREITWRDMHAMERVSHSDETFRAFLSTNEWTPDHHVHKGCGDCRKCGATCRRYCPCAKWRSERVQPRIKSVPSEDLVFTLTCADGPISFPRCALMLLNTAQRNGYINVRDCTTEQVRALIERSAA